MAISKVYQSSLQLVFDDGADILTGKTIYKTKSFNSVKPEANADALFAVANAFAGLQERPLFNIERKDASEIQND